MKQAEKKIQAYCGPTLPGIAVQFTVYSDGLPEGLQRLAEEMPMIAALIVPVRRLAEVRGELEKPGSAMRRIYEKAEAAWEKRRKV